MFPGQFGKPEPAGQVGICTWRMLGQDRTEGLSLNKLGGVRLGCPRGLRLGAGPEGQCKVMRWSQRVRMALRHAYEHQHFILFHA